MRELLDATFPVFSTDERGKLEIPDQWDQLLELGDLLRREFKTSIPHTGGASYAFYILITGIEHLGIQREGDERQAGALAQVLTDAELRALQDGFVSYWNSVPRTYEYRFDLPDLGELPDFQEVNHD